MPGTYQAVYNGSKAFLDSFAVALNQELKETGVSVTCLMPGATETDFFQRADMLDTKVGTEEKADAAEVARTGFDAMMKCELKVVAGQLRALRAIGRAGAPRCPAPALATRLPARGRRRQRVLRCTRLHRAARARQPVLPGCGG